jgi:peptidoglycan/xylan/chitin deacetylase (PgdA/CDA1 family)
MAGIQTVLGSDMETDMGSWTPFYEGLLNGPPGILELLAKREITATFFFTGARARKHPDVLQRVRPGQSRALNNGTRGVRINGGPASVPAADRWGTT